MIQSTVASDTITEKSAAVDNSYLKAYECGTHELVLQTVRCLIADICQQYNGGHPGSAIGMAAMGVALFKYVMKYSPRNSNLFDRDRLILSNGHTCLWQYTFMHLTGYPSISMDELKSYHSTNQNSVCRGHPEIQFDGIEVSTGPLGQGVANAVGLAVASKNVAATYNRPGLEIMDNMIWCVVGDACLQEGVAMEAIQLAGHWKLDTLTILYDNNGITCCGALDITTSENVNAKMEACGWHVIDVLEGDSNVVGIVKAMLEARQNKTRPTFINIRTVIGSGTCLAGLNKAHGTPLGPQGVNDLKSLSGLDPDRKFFVSHEVYDFFADVIPRGEAYESLAKQKLETYSSKYPLLAAELQGRMSGDSMLDWQIHLPLHEDLPIDKTATRISAGKLVASLARSFPSVCVATCDLQPATNMSWEGYTVFQAPDHHTACGTMIGDYSGRYLQCGIREHAMASISNGLAAFNIGTMLPITSGFFMFYAYAAAGIRMGALQGLQAIHLVTHDSIAIGDDGPTHQPIELPALFRAMPNLLFIRPCDEEEVCGAFMVALENKRTPTMISLSRHKLVQYHNFSKRDGVRRGAYVFIEQVDADVTLISTGSEMMLAVQSREKLKDIGVRARIVSFPCQRLFEEQFLEYRESVMQYSKSKPIVVIEAYAVTGWERYADAGYSMRTFGKSLPAEDEIYGFFRFQARAIAEAVGSLVKRVADHGIGSLRGNFLDLNGGPMTHGFDPQ